MQKPLVFKATRLLVTYDDGTPVVLIINFGPGHIRCFRVDDKDFNAQLRMAGINKTVIVDKFATQQQDNGPSKLVRS